MATWTNSRPAPPLAAERGALPRAFTGDAAADVLELAELLDVEVDQFAGMSPLVADHRAGRLDVLEPRQPGALEHPVDGGRRNADLTGNMTAGEALPPERNDLFDNSGAVAWGMENGRDERSTIPARQAAL